MYDVTREELVAAVEAEEREWLSTDDIHPYKSRVPQTKGNTVSFPKITKFNTYLLNHYGAEIVEEINGLLYDGELAAICGVDGFYSQQGQWMEILPKATPILNWSMDATG